jgi:hypothetical protein
MIEITSLVKSDGPLSKHISLGPDGKLRSDGSACFMAAGEARRLQVDLLKLSRHIDACESDHAIALGRLRNGLSDVVEIRTKRALNGHAQQHGIIARTADNIVYQPGQPAFVLIDIDTKDLPGHVRDWMAASGDPWQALVSVLPGLASVGRVMRRSTSSGLYRTDTGERLSSSGGWHIYLELVDGADCRRFLYCLHARCRLHGLGWLTVGSIGQLLERSLIDRSVCNPERIVFEGAPTVDPPLAQDKDIRRSQVVKGLPLDSRAACPDLSVVECARLAELKAAEAHRLKPDRDRAREQWIRQFAQRTGCSLNAARQAVERLHAGVLLPDVVLPFDAPELKGKTVADVLADPDQFIGETLADPIEGEEYGCCKAQILRRADGSLWVHSFAHGGAAYDLRHDARTIETTIRNLDPQRPAAIVDTFIKLLLTAELAADAEQRLRDLVCELSGTKPRPLAARIKAARQQQQQQQEQAERERRAAERTDPRQQLPAPTADAPWLPQMQALNEVLGTVAAPEPPMRNVEGYATMIRERRVPTLHTLTARSANAVESEETRLPAPEEPLLSPLDEAELAELIERHIDHVDGNSRSVHLPTPFVRHFQKRTDHVLPVVTSVTTLPLVLPDGSILSGRGLDRERGIVFRVPEPLEALLPRINDCTATPVATAMQFLVDDWLGDVAADYIGKCALIALALSIIVRAILPERPAFLVSGGKRGTGKTTVINMITMAVLGRRAAASAWSSNEEERRKALFSYLGEGVAVLVWDNIPLGTAISCPSIEKALTAETYTDRVLGLSENRTVPASTIQVFTGNNLVPRGDMASRTLTIRLSAGRPDPENRTFMHTDPIAWTEAHRGRILSALYTILLGNLRLTAIGPSAPETRFKPWWQLVGAAVERAAREHQAHVEALTIERNHDCPPAPVAFRKLFLDGEADEEQASSLGEVLRRLRERWPRGCQARAIAAYVRCGEEDAVEFMAALEQASGKAIKVISATTITWRLKALVDAPVALDDAVCALRYQPENMGGTFAVKTIQGAR